MFNEKPRFKSVLKYSMNLFEAVLCKYLKLIKSTLT